MSRERTVERLVAYEDRTARLMVVLAFAFIALYAYDVLVIAPPPLVSRVLSIASGVIWGVFAVDLGIRVWLAPQRGRYLLRHPIDVIAVVIPAFRSLRVLRVFTAGQWLLRRGARVAVGKTMAAIAVSAFTVACLGALAVLDAERGAPGAHIETLGDGLWWAATTMSTVGYGDLFPVTTAGRFVGVALMVVGVSMLGVITATVAAWFVEQVRGHQDDDTAVLAAEIRALRAEVAQMRAAEAAEDLG